MINFIVTRHDKSTDCRTELQSDYRIAGPQGEIFRLSGADSEQLTGLMAVPVVAARPAGIRNFQAGTPCRPSWPHCLPTDRPPLENEVGFAVEAFLMAGGWLVFGDAQQLWIGRNDRDSAEAVRVAAQGGGREAAA